VSQDRPAVSVPIRPGRRDSEVHFDLMVLGGGSAGFAAAITACDTGKRVALANAGPLGGTCTNRGCIPSKALIRAAEMGWRAGHHPFAGVETTQNGVDWPPLQAPKDRLIGELRQRRYNDVLTAFPDIRLLDGAAVFQSDGSVQVGERSWRADRYVIATGARPRIVPFPGAEQAESLDSTSLMDLTKLPESLVVLGGRAVALGLGPVVGRIGV